MVLCRLELTLLNMSFPTMVAMVGKTRAPHRILVADTWSASGLASAGMRGTGQPMPAETNTEQLLCTLLWQQSRWSDSKKRLGGWGWREGGHLGRCC